MAELSTYTIVVSLNDGVAFINCVSGAIDYVDAKTFHAIETQLGDANGDLSATLVRLKQRGHVTDDVTTEKQRFQRLSAALHRKASASAINTFWVIPTYKCNLRCSYCFQPHELHRGTGRKDDVMSPEMASSLLTSLEVLGGSGPNAEAGRGRYITLFGGEPLMHETRECIETIVCLGKSRGYRLGAVTNGVELDQFADLLGPNGIRWLQITVDGLRPRHEKLRLCPSGPTFERMLSNIDLALAAGCSVSIRTNLSRGAIKDMPDLARVARDRGWEKNALFSWYATPIEFHNNPSLEKTAAGDGVLQSWSLSDHSQIIRTPYATKVASLLRTLTKRGLRSRVEASSCGAHSGMYFFDPVGNIYSCAEQAGHFESAVGAFKDGQFYFAETEMRRWLGRHVGAIPECVNCPYAFFCGGGCANAALKRTGSLFSPNCNGFQQAFQSSSRPLLEQMISQASGSAVLGELQVLSLNDDSLLLSPSDPEAYAGQVVN